MPSYHRGAPPSPNWGKTNAFVIAQALAVGLFAELQILALKREPAEA